MSLEQSIDELKATVDKLVAAVEAATGVLVTVGATGKGGAPAAAAPPAASRGPGRPKAAPASPPPADEGLGGDDGGLGGLGGDDGGLGGDDTSGVTVEDAKTAVLAYRDKAIKVKGKEEGLNLTRQLMKKFVPALDDINDDNAAEIHKAFTAEVGKIKK